MKWKRWASIATVMLLTLGAAWTYLIVSYEPPLGTDNTVLVKDLEGVLANGTMDELATLSFAEGGEDLAWTSLQIEIMTNEQQYTCSFGSQSIQDLNERNVVATLGADGSTFTTMIDATEDSFTYLDVPNQQESNLSDYTMRFSTTDVFFSEGIQWAFLEGQNIGEITSINSTKWSNATDDRLEWYTYDIAVHRVNPIFGTYLILEDSVVYKIQFLTYYSDEDESRYPTMLISTLDKTEFPALNNPNLVVPSPCLIQSDDDTLSYWNATETITLLENGMNICSSSCFLEVIVLYETRTVKIENIESLT